MKAVQIEVDEDQVLVGEVTGGTARLKPVSSLDAALDTARELLTKNPAAEKAFADGFEGKRPSQDRSERAFRESGSRPVPEKA